MNYNWRSKDPKSAWDTIEEYASRFGITRIANITGLDHIGIPVFSGIRPNSRTIVASAGKGLTNIESAVSAGMEAIETEVAERLNRSETIQCRWNELKPNQRILLNDLPLLPKSILDSNTILSWSVCESLNKNSSCYLPSSMIGMNAESVIEPLRIFPTGSNGLASGLSLEDAILSGLYELIERDAMRCWINAIHNKGLRDAYINTESINYDSTKSLISKIEISNLNIYLSNWTTDIGISVFRCLIVGDIDATVSITEGFGCHHITEIAINRAITEAVQARTVIIAGARDDFTSGTISNSPKLYKEFMNNKKNMLFEDLIETTEAIGSTKEAIKDIQERLSNININDIWVYEFDKCEPFSVVRLICIGLAPLTYGWDPGIYKTTNHPRLHSFSPRIYGIRKVLYELRNKKQ